MPITTETRLIHQYGEMWLATIRSIHQQELQRDPLDNELADHLAWILEGGVTADSLRAFVQSLDEWKDKQAAP